MKSRLLVVHTGGVGDFICTFPTLSALARSVSIEVAGLPERVALAQAAGIADAVHDLESTGFASVFSEPNGRFRAFAARFDRALVWMADHDGKIAEGLMRSGISAVRCAPGIPPGAWDQHAAEWYACASDTGVSLPFQAPFERGRREVDVLIQPGSGSRSKNWPLANFEALAGRLEAAGCRVAWCLGPAEEEWPSRSDALPPMPLVDLAGVLAGARLFVGNDSGISHLAAATGCPTVAIFGPTNPRVWRPAGPCVRALGGCGVWPDLDGVYEAANALRAGSGF